jgi:hypothetical protein
MRHMRLPLIATSRAEDDMTSLLALAVIAKPIPRSRTFAAHLAHIEEIWPFIGALSVSHGADWIEAWLDRQFEGQRRYAREQERERERIDNQFHPPDLQSAGLFSLNLIAHDFKAVD